MKKNNEMLTSVTVFYDISSIGPVQQMFNMNPV